MFMSSVEYPSVLKGVSTQRWDLRVPGALNESLNMVCDPITGLRRRPGFIYRARLPIADAAHWYSWYQELNGVPVHLFIDPKTGTLRAYDTSFNHLASVTSTYLIGTAENLRHTALAGTAWVANTAIKPVLSYSDPRQNPATCGYFSCLLGEFEKVYDLTLVVSYTVGGVTTQYSQKVTYTTPASGAGTASSAVPTAVAEQLRVLIVAAYSAAGFPGTITSTRQQNSVLLQIAAGTGGVVNSVRVSSGNTRTYLMTSETMVAELQTDLPGKLPDAADGIIVAQGRKESTYVYFQYDKANALWRECPAYGYVRSVSNTPVLVSLASTRGTYTLSVDASSWPGALSGNSESNAIPRWMQEGISGMTSLQGRLGIMSGDSVCFSQSGYPTRHFRTTVATLDSSDRISVTGGSAGSATFTRALTYNKDLLLFSESHLCVIPVGSAVLTPANTSLVTNCRMNAADLSPVETGQSVQFLSPASTTAIYEVYPDSVTSGVYTVASATDHLRGYVPAAKWAVGMPGVGFSAWGTPTKLLVNEYVWAGTERPLNAWHTWTPPAGTTILAMHGTHDRLVLLLNTSSGNVLFVTIDPRDVVTGPVDLAQVFFHTDGHTSIPHDAATALPTGDWWMLGENPPVRCTYNADRLTLPYLTPGGFFVTVGIAFESAVEFPPYIPRGQNGLGQFEEAILVSAAFDMSDTGECLADVPGYTGLPISGVLWQDEAFDAAHTPSPHITVEVPVRERMPLAFVRLSTSQPQALNIIRVIYKTRLNNRFRRM